MEVEKEAEKILSLMKEENTTSIDKKWMEKQQFHSVTLDGMDTIVDSLHMRNDVEVDHYQKFVGGEFTLTLIFL